MSNSKCVALALLHTFLAVITGGLWLYLILLWGILKDDDY